jgi:hypothetical protein
MAKKHKINFTKTLVKEYMTLLPNTRNSNLELLKEIWIDEAEVYGLDPEQIKKLIQLVKEQKMQNPITIARTKNLVLEEHPEWRTNDPDQDERDYVNELNQAR